MSSNSLEIVEKIWDESIVPTLSDFIRIPAKSPAFDPQWFDTGHLDEAVRMIEKWCQSRGIEGLQSEILQLDDPSQPGGKRTPVLFIEIPGDVDDTVLLYGHFDKQPEAEGWDEGFGPWIPRIKDNRLYGRGSADDGYAVFASIAAIEAVRVRGGKHARCVLVIEGCEESGSYDLPPYLDHLAERIGTPSLVVCLDSGCGNYDQLWVTTSLRGNITGNLSVDIVKDGVHSGGASGIAPSSFRILRQLLSRIEDENTGEFKVPGLMAEIPPSRVEQAAQVAEILGDTIWNSVPFVEGARPVSDNIQELILNNTWRPTLCVTGAEGLPPLAEAGNVLRTGTAVKISLRLGPTVDTVKGAEIVKEVLEKDPPYGARVRFEGESGEGFAAPEFAPWLQKSMEEGSRAHFGRDVAFLGEGGSIPLMALLGEKFPDAQFFIAGVLGPNSNAHGPNEFLDLPMVKRVTACVVDILEAHAGRTR